MFRHRDAASREGFECDLNAYKQSRHFQEINTSGVINGVHGLCAANRGTVTQQRYVTFPFE